VDTSQEARMPSAKLSELITTVFAWSGEEFGLPDEFELADINARIDALLEQIVPLFKNKSHDLIGAVLTELLTLYIAGLPKGDQQEIISGYFDDLPSEIEKKQRQFFSNPQFVQTPS
jgi:hypothetical protein